MYANSLLGAWPFIFEENPCLQKLYRFYSNCTLTYFFAFIVTAIMELFILMADAKNRLQDIMANLCITLLYWITLLRVSRIRTEKVKGIIRGILLLEDKIYKCEDEEIIQIYKSYAHQSQVTNIIFITNIFVETVFYFIHPLYVDDVVTYNPATNTTTITKALPLSSWFPFDKQENYFLTYMWHIADGTVGASYVMFTDVFSFSLIIFPIGQIKILIHILTNFQKYVLKVQQRVGCSREEASFVTLRECIIKHKEIIRYVYEYNKSMENIMVLDFLQSSLQLASVIIQILVVKEVKLFDIVFSSEFVMCMIIRLLVYYWYANEVMLQSFNLGMAIWDSEWYTEPVEVQRLMVIMIMKSNKPLTFDIGPFSAMTLASFLGILKATYSYMMVMYR